MSSRRAITAAAAKQDAELWKRVQRGECHVRTTTGRTLCAVDNNGRFAHGDYDWRHDALYFGWPVGDDDLLTVTTPDPSEWLPNSPAAVDALQARAHFLEVALADASRRLAAAEDARPRVTDVGLTRDDE